MLITSPYRFYSCGDHAITIELGEVIDPVINSQVIAIFQYLKENPIVGIKDIIPAYSTVTIVYDIVLLKKQYPGTSIYTMMCDLLKKAMNDFVMPATAKRQVINIPVCYDISLAPDINSLATLHKISIEEVIDLHARSTYQVYMIGFLPGFAYMGSVDKKIITPRLAKPRTSVPAGSVGIAGEQTGIYPFESPGGWQLIGQTPVRMFDAEKELPCYLQPGDEVKFYPISLPEFQKMKHS